MTDTKNFKCYKRLINRQLFQVSGLCSTWFFSYLPKHFTQIYRAQYGDAMLAPLWGAPTWRLEINENIWNSLLLWEQLLFPHELVCIHKNTSSNVLTVQTAKNLKKRPFFQTRQLCHGAVLRSRTVEISKIQDAVFWTQRVLPRWKLVKRFIFSRHVTSRHVKTSTRILLKHSQLIKRFEFVTVAFCICIPLCGSLGN